MKRAMILMAAILLPAAIFSQQSANLPYKMEELTSPQFTKAVDQAGGVCIIPLGVIEKHGPHLPIGTDVYESREVSFQAAAMEYAIVFPTYYFGQIFEARHQPGTMAYSPELLWKMLEETCAELSRNGLKKIILKNGHGGNTNFLQYFCQAQLEKKRDYVVVMFRPGDDKVYGKEIESLEKAKLDSHAGERETAMMYFINPSFVDQSALGSQSGLDQNRLDIPYGYTGIWWFAKFPNHFAADVYSPNKRLGEILLKGEALQLAELVKFMKNDKSIRNLQDEFFRRADDPANQR